MTFAVVIATPTTIWACADRQLGKESRPTGVKIAIVQASDGTALLTYAGIGRIGTTEVSQWVGRTLTGLDWPLDRLLKQIADAAPKRLLPVAAIYKQNHAFIASAFHQGSHRIYTIDKDALAAPSYLPRRGIIWESAGTGRNILEKHYEDRRVAISRLIRLCDLGIVSTLFIAKQLAELNLAVSRKARTTDGISAECTVVCYALRGKDARFGHWAFDDKGFMQVQKMGLVPQVQRGQLTNEVGEALWGQLIEKIQASPADDCLKVWKECIAELNANLQARLSKVTNKPDDSFK